MDAGRYASTKTPVAALTIDRHHTNGQIYTLPKPEDARQSAVSVMLASVLR
ncbi:hypothetical protein FC99_GL001576 [Levilactobacillus koreensis JCM 16448]|nr:hypothetical protein FC99_GL001576 [Levilactobacillus koreensis JCM 16448]